MLRSPRLLLVPASARHLRADLVGPAALGTVLGASVPADWPPDLVEEDRAGLAARLEADPALVGWLPWYWITATDDGARLVGFGGFGGRPDRHGTVTLAYAVVPSGQRRGYATEAVAAIVGWAFATGAVRRVEAETLPHLHASIAVLERNGFTRSRDSSASGVLRFERDMPLQVRR